MKSVRRLAAVLALLLCAPLAAQAAGARVIVKYKADSELLRKQVQSAGQEPAQRAQALGQRLGLALAAGHALGERAQVVFASGMTSEALAERLAQESDVEYAVPDRRKRLVAAPNDPLYLSGPAVTLGAQTGGPVVGQWYLRAPAGEVRSAINAEAAWDTTTGSASVVVAVVDTGIRSDHPDLAANLLPGYDMISDADTANDGNGRDANAADDGDWLDQADINSGNFAPCTANDISNSSWHGTEVAGIVGAITNNSAGMASVGRTVKVLPVRALGKCGGFDSDIIAGMRWAAGLSVTGVPTNANPAKVINLSLGGGSGCSAAYRDAVNAILAQGATIVASAGNGAGHVVSEPAACAGVIGVAGLRHVGSKVGFSDIGPEVGISAPGGNCVNVLSGQPCLYPILTTSNSGATTPVSNAAGGSIYTDSFRATLGTSFSAPLVAGTAALMYAVRPALTPAEARQLIHGTARAFPTAAVLGAGAPAECTAPQFDLAGDPVDQDECVCSTGTCGAGMLDAGAAVLAANAGTLALKSRARIDVPTRALRATQAIALDGTDSEAASGRTITQYQWSLLDGGGIVGSIAAAASATASVTPSAAGSFKVRLTVTDSAAVTSTADLTVVVLDAPVTPPTTGGGGGGGGSLSAAWLLLLSLALLALRRAPAAARVQR
jgi:serine protease